MNEIARFHGRNRELGDVEGEFLEYFAENPYLSAYQIRSLRDSQSRSMIYKNVHTRVKKLNKLGLIERVEKQSDHAAKFYRIATGGIYNLIYKRRRSFLRLLDKVLHHHGENTIFATLLYPYFDRYIIIRGGLSLESIGAICSYLYACCDQTEIQLDSIKKAGSTHFGTEEVACLWQNLPDVKKELEILRKFLQVKLDIDWINNIEELYIRKIDEGNALKISYRKNYVLIRPGEKIVVNGKPVEGYNVYLVAGALYIDTPGMSYEQFASLFLESGIKKNVSNLVLALTISQIPDSDFEILSRDTKFMELLEETESKFKGSYNKLVRLANEA